MGMVKTITAASLVERFAAGSARSEKLFAHLTPEAFWMRPIPLRHPICFYRGHLAAFTVNTLLKRGLGRSEGVKPEFEVLFERGIDPSDAAAAQKASIHRWPEREEIESYVRLVHGRVVEALEALDRGGRPGPLALPAALTIIEHEMMHQETLLYIFHRLPFKEKRKPDGYAPVLSGGPLSFGRVRVPAGPATLGADPASLPFGWDNEFPLERVLVPEFEIDRTDVTNGQFLEFLEAGGYDNQNLWEPEDWRWRVSEDVQHPIYWARRDGAWFWLAMFEEVPLPLSWPVYVSLAEARAFARWKGARLPTEAQFHRAAYGTPEGSERSYPWGEEPPDAARGNFDFRSWDPAPVGSFPAGESAWGVSDLLGNGWERTSSVFAGFPGFEPMPTYPNYSADFFDGQHFVMKGGSPATDVALLRRSFRNWFQARYRYPYATFRCVWPAA
jgi:ergothioneine biosynthesis protein EgtB